MDDYYYNLDRQNEIQVKRTYYCWDENCDSFPCSDEDYEGSVKDRTGLLEQARQGITVDKLCSAEAMNLDRKEQENIDCKEELDNEQNKNLSDDCELSLSQSSFDFLDDDFLDFSYTEWSCSNGEEADDLILTEQNEELQGKVKQIESIDSDMSNAFLDVSLNLLDDLDENDLIRQFADVQVSGDLDRNELAYQEAEKLAVIFDFSEKNTEKLVAIFESIGLGPTAKAVKRELENGTSLDELVLAAKLKQVWGIHSEFIASGYSVLSWPTALMIVRLYDYLPDVEEVEFLLETFFENWRNKANLYCTFRSFTRYLFYCLGGVPGSLSGIIPEWTFESDEIVDNGGGLLDFPSMIPY